MKMSTNRVRHVDSLWGEEGRWRFKRSRNPNNIRVIGPVDKLIMKLLKLSPQSEYLLEGKIGRSFSYKDLNDNTIRK